MDRNTILLFAGIGAVLLLATLIARVLRRHGGYAVHRDHQPPRHFRSALEEARGIAAQRGEDR